MRYLLMIIVTLAVIVLFALGAANIGACAEVSYADAYAHADKTPMVLVHSAPWCPHCHPYYHRLARDVDAVLVDADSPKFLPVPHTEVYCRIGDKWSGYDFVGVQSTVTIQEAVRGCQWLINSSKGAKP